MKSVTSIARGLLDLIAPPTCIACGEPLDPGEGGFCPRCSSLLEPASPDREAAAALLYGGPVVEAIQRFKYGGRSELAKPLAALMVEPALAMVRDVDRIIPIPLHPRRLRERGFNHAALLARRLAAHLALRLDTGTLRRVRDTPPQASIDRKHRVTNVRGAFAARPLRGSRVLLIDDVRTTGATFASAAETLLAAGAVRVRTLALARACP